MLPYQEQYVNNLRQIAAESAPAACGGADFESWYALLRAGWDRVNALREENIALLRRHLFPMLDDLHAASEEELAALSAFGDVLMDWKSNLDCGTYVLIHDSLLRLCRLRRDRSGIIRELYKLGMGLYYQNRSVLALAPEWRAPFFFRNEMVFTEAGAYLKFFSELDSEETKGYVIRALDNIAICATDKHRRVAVTDRVLKLVKDEYYRAMAPGLPWDSFYRKSLQQMSSNRSVLSDGGMSKEELAAVLEACHEVFLPEQATQNPNVRWIWPYYEMEYSCGFADLWTTLDRMERLILSVPVEQHDVSGLYANVQLPIFYGQLLKNNPAALQKESRRAFLAKAYGRMLRSLLTLPLSRIDVYALYDVTLVTANYYETEGVPTYREVTEQLMRRFCPRLYLRSRLTGALLARLCAAICRAEPGFFDDVPFLAAMPPGEAKERLLLEFAADCGLYHDFGLLKMHLDRLCQSRELYEDEQSIYQLHTVSGRDDLAGRKSTERFADCALGHHAWYGGSGGYGESYVRARSPYRQMTDALAVAVYLVEHREEDLGEVCARIAEQERRRFSPPVTAYLGDAALRAELAAVLEAGEKPWAEELYREIVCAEPASAPDGGGAEA